MTTPQGQNQFPHWPNLSRLLFLVACVLFFIAAFTAGGDGPFGHGTGLAWFFGGFAYLALGWAFA